MPHAVERPLWATKLKLLPHLTSYFHREDERSELSGSELREYRKRNLRHCQSLQLNENSHTVRVAEVL
ncbi:MAG: hypothetical protein ACE5FJ_04835, partial [Gemmatimonadales bacterium]